MVSIEMLKILFESFHIKIVIRHEKTTVFFFSLYLSLLILTLSLVNCELTKYLKYKKEVITLYVVSRFIECCTPLFSIILYDVTSCLKYFIFTHSVNHRNIKYITYSFPQSLENPKVWESDSK